MLYGGELKLLCDTLGKSGMRISVTSLKAPVKDILDSSTKFVWGNVISQEMPIRGFLDKIEPNTLYKLTDAHKFSYIYFLLPNTDKETLVFIGPYVSTAFSIQKISAMGTALNLSSENQGILDKLCATVPIIPDNSPVFLLIDTFCEHIWGDASFSVVDVNKEKQLPATPINYASESESSDDILFKMQLMEQRYKYENELMQAVTLGQINKVNLLFSVVSDIAFEKRVSDQLRNMKNYCIIMNTLLRKAAENGGVHPIYLDSVSSDFAVRIEQITAISDIGNMMRDMFRSYCRLVRKHTMKDYSPLVQNTIIFIESDLSADLSLSSLAAVQKVSPGYLSTAFKRETKMTVTEYIREKRIKHATHLLSTTHLQIQTIALNCGIMDLQYFSKLFKRQTGMTPKEYRESIKQ